MFVENLNKAQQIALYKTAEVLIKCDGKITNEELVYLQFLEKQMPAIPDTNFEVAMLKGLFNTKKEKVSFLLELIAIAHTDEEYHSTEVNLVTEISQILEIDSSLLDELEDWVVKQTVLLSEADDLME